MGGMINHLTGGGRRQQRWKYVMGRRSGESAHCHRTSSTAHLTPRTAKNDDTPVNRAANTNERWYERLDGAAEVGGAFEALESME